jgi:hypothetical protein
MEIKLQVFEAMVIPVLMYGSECWTMRKEDERRILVAEMCRLRRVLGVFRLQHIRNDDIRRRTGTQVTTVDRVKTRRLRWFGLVSRMGSDRIPYLSLHTMKDGMRSRGRPRARWRDGVMEDIKERGLEFPEATSLTKDMRWMDEVCSALSSRWHGRTGLMMMKKMWNHFSVSVQRENIVILSGVIIIV